MEQATRDELWKIHLTVPKKHTPGTDADVAFLALGLAGEVGELSNIIKKVWRGDKSFADKDVQEALCEEIADVRAYLALLGMALNIDEDRAVTLFAMPKIRKRWPLPK